jgi:hypothetical protein
MAQTLDISIISSTTGGDESDAYDRETTIDRIQQAIASILIDHIPRGQISTVKMRVKKPGGMFRRSVRSMRSMAGVRVTNVQLRIAIGSFLDMDRSKLIHNCQAAVPEIVTTNVPADHMCSLVIAFKDDARS